MCIPAGQSECKSSKCKHGKLKSGDKELNHLWAPAIWASLHHDTSSLFIHFEKMCSCELMCAASMCRAERVAQIYLLELAWRGLAWIPMQCSSISESFGFLCIEDCVSLYYTTHASCDIFQLVVNGLAKKRNGCAGLYRSTQRTSLLNAGDSSWNNPKFIEDRSYNHGQWMLCC